MNWGFFEALRRHKHSSGHRAVGLALAIRAKAEDPVCNPSITTLCKDASVCRLTVVRAVERFEQQGLIKVERRFGAANKYRLTSSSTRLVQDPHQSTGETGSNPDPSTGETGRYAGTSLNSEPHPSTGETQKRLKDRKQGEKHLGHEDQHADLPDWLPEEQWLAFLEHRHALKSAMTPHAQKLAITELRKLRDQGHHPAQVLEQSIINGWKGLFEIKGNRGRKSEPATLPRESDEDIKAAVKEAERHMQRWNT